MNFLKQIYLEGKQRMEKRKKNEGRSKVKTLQKHFCRFRIIGNIIFSGERTTLLQSYS